MTIEADKNGKCDFWFEPIRVVPTRKATLPEITRSLVTSPPRVDIFASSYGCDGTVRRINTLREHVGRFPRDKHAKGSLERIERENGISHENLTQ